MTNGDDDIAEIKRDLARLRREMDELIVGLREKEDFYDLARDAYEAGGDRPKDLSPWTIVENGIVRTSRDGAIVARVYPSRTGSAYCVRPGFWTAQGNYGHHAEHHGIDCRQASKDAADAILRSGQYNLDVVAEDKPCE